MSGKAIIFAIAGLLIWAAAVKYGQKLGLVRPKAPTNDKKKKFALTPFNVMIGGLIALYILWGLGQITG